MEQYLLASEVVKRRFGVVIDQTKLCMTSLRG